MRSLVRSLALALLLAACAREPAGSAHGDELVIGAGADVYFAGGDDATLGLYPVNTTIYEPLVRLSPSYDVLPWLATRWEFRPPNTWRFHLRRGVRFHDGSLFTAEDVRWSVERLARLGGAGSPGLVAGSARVVDDSTVDLTPAHSNRRLPEQLVHPVWSIMKSGSRPDSLPIGTGPYRFVSYARGDRIVVDRNERYWGVPPNVARLTFRFIPDPATRVLALRAGDVDVAAEFPREAAAQYATDSRVRVERSEVSGYEVLYGNVHGAAPHDLMNEHAVRRAFAHAVDRERVAREVWLGAAEPWPTVIPAALLASHVSLIRGAAHDPARARAILDSAGWRVAGDGIRARGGRRLSLTLVVGFPNAEIHRPMPELVQGALRDIGVEVRIQQVPDDATFHALMRGVRGDLWAEAGGQNDANPCFLPDLLFYSGRRARPSVYARLFAPGAALDAYVDRCRTTLVTDSARHFAAQAERILVDVAHVIIPLAATRRVWGVGPRVRGFLAHPSALSQRWDEVSVAR